MKKPFFFVTIGRKPTIGLIFYIFFFFLFEGGMEDFFSVLDWISVFWKSS